MYQTYPKGSAHPSSKVGEQDTKATWPDSSRTKYGNTTVKDTVYNGERAKTKSCSGVGKIKGGGNKQKSCSYPKSRTQFGSEKHVGK